MSSWHEAVQFSIDRWKKSRMSRFLRKKQIKPEEVHVHNDIPIDILVKNFKRENNIKKRLYIKLLEGEKQSWIDYYEKNRILILMSNEEHEIYHRDNEYNAALNRWVKRDKDDTNDDAKCNAKTVPRKKETNDDANDDTNDDANGDTNNDAKCNAKTVLRKKETKCNTNDNSNRNAKTVLRKKETNGDTNNDAKCNAKTVLRKKETKCNTKCNTNDNSNRNAKCNTKDTGTKARISEAKKLRKSSKHKNNS